MNLVHKTPISLCGLEGVYFAPRPIVRVNQQVILIRQSIILIGHSVTSKLIPVNTTQMNVRSLIDLILLNWLTVTHIQFSVVYSCLGVFFLFLIAGCLIRLSYRKREMADDKVLDFEKAILEIIKEKIIT